MEIVRVRQSNDVLAEKSVAQRMWKENAKGHRLLEYCTPNHLNWQDIASTVTGFLVCDHIK